MITTADKLELSKDITLLRKKNQEVEPLSYGLSSIETVFNSIAATVKNKFTLDRFESKETNRVIREASAELDAEPTSPELDTGILTGMFDVLSEKLTGLSFSSGGGSGGGIVSSLIGGAALAGAGYMAYKALEPNEKEKTSTPVSKTTKTEVQEKPAPVIKSPIEKPIQKPIERNFRVDVGPSPFVQENKRVGRSKGGKTQENNGAVPYVPQSPPVRQTKQSQSQIGGIDWKSIFNKGILATPFGLAAGVAAGISKTVQDAIEGVGRGFEEGAQGVTPMSGNAAAKRAMDYFMSKGWTKEQAAGLVGNLQVESGNFSPAFISGKERGDGGKAVGVAQWHPDRQARFKEKYGKSIVGASLDEQLAFIQHELETYEKGAAEKLKKAKTAAEAASIVDQYYERSLGSNSPQGGPSRKQRIANANSLVGKNGAASEVGRAVGSIKRGIDTAGAEVAQFIRGGPTASPVKAIESAGLALKGEGFLVSEQRKFGGVTSGVHHGKGHAQERAIDINIKGFQGKNWEANDPEARRKFDEIAKRYGSAGYTVIWRGRYWPGGKPGKENSRLGHYNHMHIEAPLGSNLPIPQLAKPVQNNKNTGKTTQQASQEVRIRKIKRNRRIVVQPPKTASATPVVVSNKTSKPLRVAVNAGEKYRMYFA